MSFAPPSDLDADTLEPPPPPTEIADDATGDDAYARRMRLSQAQHRQFQQPRPPPPPPPLPTPSPAPPVFSSTRAPASQISRAPVRYSLPPAPEELPASEDELAAKLAEDNPEATLTDAPSELEQTRSSRPGQAGFAERLLSKYGWTKGSGLGAQGTGIVNPLYAKVDRRKKRSDAEGGGYITPAGTGKILGGQKSKATQEEDQGKFGAMSEVVKLEGMLRGLDLDVELNREEGGIMQEIGEECAEKYGSVERVYIDRSGGEADGGVVFVQFISQLSALRAVNALEGRVFGGNVIKARFWDREKFEQGLYE
jgi:splicing factor 45